MPDENSPPVDLVVSPEALGSFRGRLDDVLTTTQAAGLTPSLMADLRMDQANYGGLIPGMTQISHEFGHAVDRLEAFVRIQQDLIEALTIATLISERGFENVEAEQRQRLQQIMSHLAEDYTPPPPVTDEDLYGRPGLTPLP
ncbi:MULTISPECIES: hypothetical protein [Streptomyces]|uniref:hypothetical protein n=1 Tax=Streptomyces TaxID=1883 RepID=UPI0019069B5E|nr:MULTISPECIES: hypothetical protein [unclassified Streptomyces]MCU4750082.1 hypothetical protein [Streptomyces sp. G-5]QQN76902.1 hypothetical protein IPZ77_05175 [Streptomyces sp. XC 2026]